jgi:hypothetical protein
MRYLLICLLTIFISCTSSEKPHNLVSTQLPSQTVSLTDLSAFQESPANWQIAGSVYADRHQERAIEAEAGTGVLVNIPQESTTGENLFTSFEHGDLDLELEFMMASSSNSGVYLQGRYEVQLFDSWGKDSVRFADCGGIYQRWQNEQGFGGVPPRTNACYAPGLWQHLSVKFEAPRFDAQGKKVRDALFREVVLNGVVIHENVPVSGPTRAAAFEDEQPLDPLMLQGDHGPVAFRNIRYKRYGTERITLNNITYEFYEGQFLTPDTLASLDPNRSGQSDSISYQLAQQPQEYALVFSGTLTAPTNGEYLMTLRTAGASWLWIDEEKVVDHTQGQRLDEPGYGAVSLDQGEHSFQLVFSKPGQGWRQGLAWEYEGPEIPLIALQAPGSVPVRQPPPPHVVEVSSEPALQRGFWWLDEETKKTHTIAVGLPSAVNFVYDLRNGALLSAWGGGFVDATQMWHSRGEDQTLTPLGGEVPLSHRPLVARLSSSESAWPDSVDMESDTFRYAGYQLNSEGIPVFEYYMNGARLRDQIGQQQEERSLTRNITVDFDQSASPLYCLLAEGSSINQLPDGSYGVDDYRYYLTINDAPAVPVERQQNGQTQLLLPIVAQTDPTNISYTITW